MFLKSLTLRGFKTFAEATEIEFGEEARITAIVGPNGCGKSNLLDATRWVLGEDNARHLRVAALPDIIFAGTNRRKPLSLAEVSLLFDNATGRFNVPFTEVGIRRRTFREGESEFFINKNLCRLKDIKDLLLDTGLGEGTYSIITQGQVDAILSSKGEERRAVFEEAAGINKYKTRKLNAEKKLIAAEQNILRISDLKIEVGEHLLTLEDQARRAREYLSLQAETKEIEIGLSKKQIGSLLEKKARLEAELALARQASSAKVEAEQKDEAELLGLKETLRKKELEIDELLVKLDAEKDRLRDLELNRRFVEGEIERAENQRAGLNDKKLELQKKIDQLRSNEGTEISFSISQSALAGPVRAVIEDVQRLIDHAVSVVSFFGTAEQFQLLGQKDREAAVNLKLELLLEEIKRIETESERLGFGLQANRSAMQNLLPGGAPEHGQPQLPDTIAGLRAERDSLRKKIDELEEKKRREDKDERSAESRITEFEIALAKLEGEMTGLSEKLFNEYNLTLPEIESLPHTVPNAAKARADLDEKKARLRALEPVNLLAIEEFDKSRERLTFIEAQLTDLNAARESLHSLIVELDARAEQNFLQTMEQLSVVFSETFAKLFSGGEAKVQLAEGVPVLEAEIEISVRPNGRRWLPLSQLSGGERSLCAIAILFSLMKIRPSPFCFLDEVDAALDEANIGRFTEMLKDFAATTQMLVITHNKRTMAAADNIYGVTMEEPGISKVISMKLTGAAV
ncbi:MAG: AAA family ATPase [Candidatus Margulisbacteria bacterium]|nr:AAA family ATPase [Candidatus Margulisiibacteriota bacterium]